MIKEIFKEKLVRITLVISILSLIFIGVAVYKIHSYSNLLQNSKGFAIAGETVQQEVENLLIRYQYDYAKLFDNLFNVRPTLKEIIKFLNFLESIEKDIHLKTNIKSLEKNIITDTPEISEYLKYQIKFDTSIEKTIEYIETLLNKSLYFIKIDNVFIKEDPENLPSGLYHVIINVELYIK